MEIEIENEKVDREKERNGERESVVCTLHLFIDGKKENYSKEQYILLMVRVCVCVKSDLSSNI